jgi:hypothetical protein
MSNAPGPKKYHRPFMVKAWMGIRHFFTGFFYDPAIHIRFLLHHRNTVITVPEVNWLPDDALRRACIAGRSLIRLGDGEVALLLGRSIKFQTAHIELQKKLGALISNYATSSPYILCLPKVGLSNDVRSLASPMKRSIWTLFRLYFTHRFRHQVPYADAHLFYDHEQVETFFRDDFQQRIAICVGKHDIRSSRLKEFLSTNFFAFYFIEAPAINAFAKEKELLQAITTCVQQYCTTHTPIVLLGIGPASKPIAHHLSEKSIQAIDVGHGLELLASGTSFKTKLQP